jgi:hypothetical protein
MVTTTTMQAGVFVRTEAGRIEIQARARPLGRPARNLLLVIDASCTGVQWVAKVAGSSEADLQQLVALGLVAGAAPAGMSSRPSSAPRVSLDEALQKWTYDALYTLLTHEARERFGLIRGYKLILEIEGATGLAGLQVVARKFVEMMRKVHGEEAAIRFRKQLGEMDPHGR